MLRWSTPSVLSSLGLDNPAPPREQLDLSGFPEIVSPQYSPISKVQVYSFFFVDRRSSLIYRILSNLSCHKFSESISSNLLFLSLPR
jgi:hypothetical protein